MWGIRVRASNVKLYKISVNILDTTRTYSFVTMANSLSYHNSRHYPSSCDLHKTQLSSIRFSVPHRKHIKSPLRAQQINAIYITGVSQYIIYNLFFHLKQNVSETGSRFRFQLEHTELVPIRRPSFCLRTGQNPVSEMLCLKERRGRWIMSRLWYLQIFLCHGVTQQDKTVKPRDHHKWKPCFTSFHSFCVKRSSAINIPWATSQLHSKCSQRFVLGSVQIVCCYSPTLATSKMVQMF
jgi:hypothetical protein